MVKAREIINCEIYLGCLEWDQGEVRSNGFASVNLFVKGTQSLWVCVCSEGPVGFALAGYLKLGRRLFISSVCQNIKIFWSNLIYRNNWDFILNACGVLKAFLFLKSMNRKPVGSDLLSALPVQWRNDDSASCH